MATNTNIPFEATHPGTLIKDELEVRDDITQKDLAINSAKLLTLLSPSTTMCI